MTSCWCRRWTWPACAACARPSSCCRRSACCRRSRVLALNLAEQSFGMKVKDVEAAVGLPVDIVIPRANDVQLAANHGVPLMLNKKKGGRSSRRSAAHHAIFDESGAAEEKQDPQATGRRMSISDRLARPRDPVACSAEDRRPDPSSRRPAKKVRTQPSSPMRSPRSRRARSRSCSSASARASTTRR